jgi:type IV pilus assembly protein PilP
MVRALLISLGLGFAFFLTACSEEPVQKAQVVRPRPVAKKAIKKEAVSKPKEVEPPFHYIAEDRRDPFTSLVEIREPLQEEQEPETPLQTFGLKELKLIAVVIGKGEPRAMVIAPDNKAYILTAGVKVGRNRGVVRQILNEEIIVEEQYRDFSGGLRTEIRKIALTRGGGE